MSVYGNENSLLVDSLKQLHGKARGVVGIDPKAVSDASLISMHDVGVRGARLNLRSYARELNKEQFADTLRLYAERLRPLNWALQIYVSLAQVALFADVIPMLGVPVVIDHIAHPGDLSKPPSQQSGYDEFMKLLRDKQIYTKLSGIDRFPDLSGLDEYVREILLAAPTQVIWASDWPHSGGKHASPSGDPRQLQDYRQVDDAVLIARCLEWCNHDQDLVQKVWVDNPRRLWQYESQ